MWDCATPATWNARRCHQVPRQPHKSAAASRATKTSPSAPPSATSATPATPATQNCHVKQRWMSPSATPATERWYVKDCMWQRCVCVLSLCVWSYCMWKMVCDKGVCEVMYVTDGMWQSCVLSLCVWSYCMWKMVCDKVVCEVMYVTDGVWQSCVLSLCVCEVIVCAGWYVTKLCVKFVCVKLLYVRDGVWQAEGGGRREDQPGIQNQKQEPHTKLWGTINLYKNGLSSAYPRGRALFPFGTVVKSRRNGINSCSSSSELDAQYFRPHQKTIKRKRPHLESMSLPATSFMVMCRFKSLSCSGKKEVSGC